MVEYACTAAHISLLNDRSNATCPQTLVASVWNTYPSISRDSGATWTQQTSAGIQQWRGVAVNNDGTVR